MIAVRIHAMAFALSLGTRVAETQEIPMAFIGVAAVDRLIGVVTQVAFVDVHSHHESLARQGGILDLQCSPQRDTRPKTPGLGNS